MPNQEENVQINQTDTAKVAKPFDVKKEIKEWIKDLIFAVIIAVLILVFFKPIVIQQTSMEPNFHAGDYVIVARQSYHLFSEPKRGDVVVFRSNLVDNNGDHKNLIKRIIGLPGDTIEILDDIVYINGEEIKEAYLASTEGSGRYKRKTLGDDEYFVMGDNRAVSVDSRSQSLGTVTEESMIGRVVFKLFPLGDAHVVKRIKYEE